MPEKSKNQSIEKATFESKDCIKALEMHTIGKYMNKDGVRTWDRILRQEADPNNKIIKLYDNFMKEHNDTLFKYAGMYGNGTGDPIYVRHYYMGE